jgi:hypothetical protein
MAIIVETGFTVHVSRCRESFDKPYGMKLTLVGSGMIEGDGTVVPITKDIPYDGKMTLEGLIAAAEAALAGKTSTMASAVAAAKK